MSHVCHAGWCSVEVKPEKLMCAFHWKKVPTKLKYKINKLYRQGQCDDKRPSKEWLKAAKQAIAIVLEKGS